MRRNFCLSRSSLHPDQIRSTVLAMIAEGGDATPATRANFRQLMSNPQAPSGQTER
ncbi:hypothetical protein BVI1335_820012 [Burkholderia vietnamiensis]|nr:hypothetical protein BVI1335_820012 [Burkholderia vietnamiensis]